MAVKGLFVVCGVVVLFLGCSSANNRKAFQAYDDAMSDCSMVGISSDEECREMLWCSPSMSKVECGEHVIESYARIGGRHP